MKRALNCVGLFFRKRSIALGIVLALSVSISLYAQDYKNLYKSAKDLFAKEKYAEAIDAFQALVIYDKNNPYSEHASFYVGLSAQKLGYTLLARQTFVQLEKLYPTWKNIDEVRYQLACIYFNQGDFFLAFSESNTIKDKVVAAEILKVKQFYISSIHDIETLKLLLEEFPNDEEVGKQLIASIGNQGYQRDYRSFYDSLLVRFNMEDKRQSLIPPQTDTNGSFRVSLLFPFLSTTLDPTPVKKKNQFVIDLYQGMKLAVDTLKKRNIDIELLAYDTERSLDTLKKILKMDELKSSDLLVGPLFSEEYLLANEFSIRNKIPIINPVTNNSDFLGTNKQALLMQPSYATVGVKAAEYAEKATKNKTCYVFYGDIPKDTIMAASFIKKAKELGMKVVFSEMITKEKTSTIQPTLATATEFDKWQKPIEFKVKRNSIGCIYVASDNPLIFSKVVHSVETRNDSVLVIGSENWLKDNSVDFDIYERLGILFTAPSFTSVNNTAFVDFRKRFIERHGSFPSAYENYSKIGYDFMMVIGEAFKIHGVDAFDELKKEDFVAGAVSEGYGFKKSNNNQIVPIIQFNGGELQLISKR